MKTMITFAVAGLLAIFMVAWMFGVVVPPGSMGVRQITLGSGKGFGDRGLEPGYQWRIPVYSVVHIIPETIQIVDLHRESSGFGQVQIQTTDGSGVEVDVSIAYAFHTERTAEHGGPAELITKVGLYEEQWADHIRKVVVDQLKRALGRLSTSQFYNPFDRQAQVHEAIKAITPLLAENGIRLVSVLLRRYIYTDPRIDTSIFNKNLQDQEERLNSAASKLAEARAEVEQVAAEMDAKIQTLKVDGDNKARVLRSQGDLYEAEKNAQGDLLVAKARAEADRLRAGALAQAAGSDVYVARELAPLLGSLRGGVVSQLDPYDLNGWLKRMGVERR